MPNINLGQIQSLINYIKNSNNKQIDLKTFDSKFNFNMSIWEIIDSNRDNIITENEINNLLQADFNNDGLVTKKEKIDLEQIIFAARRTADKWFTVDVDRDGHWSNVEMQMSQKRMGDNTDTSLEASMTNRELENLYNIKEEINDPNNQQIDKWLEHWIPYFKEIYGIESDKFDIIFKKEFKNQLNNWLFKTGDNTTGNAPLYNSLNTTAYTRLVTKDEIESCCGGDISKPPIGPQNPEEGCADLFRPMEFSQDDWNEINKEIKILEEKLKQKEISQEDFDAKIKVLTTPINNSDEVKNRLAWGIFNCKSQEEVAQMTPEEYQAYQEEWQKVRNMSASDFRELLKPENEDKRREFESKSIMTVGQIVQYIDIVESVIGDDNWDNDDWTIDNQQFSEITLKVNDTYGDENRLNGKTRADIPENRQNLLKFLEEKGWLHEQFKT